MMTPLHCAYILATAPFILGLKLQIDGKMDFGPKWNYEYRIKPLETDTDNLPRTFTAMDRQKISYARQNEPPKFIDIIIKNNKSSPRLIQVAEAHIFDRDDNINTSSRQVNKTDDLQQMIDMFKRDASETPEKKQNNSKHKGKENDEHEGIPIKISAEQPLKFSDEHTEPSSEPITEDALTKTGKHVHHLVRIAGGVDAPKPKELEEITEPPHVVTEEESHYRATMLMSREKKKHKRHRVKKNEIKIVTDVKPVSSNAPTTPELVSIENFPLVTAVETSFSVQDMYVKPRLVRDDPKIKEFTRHIYEQSIKTFESIKEKMNNYEMKNEADRLMRSYEEKFGDFVRETQDQKIRTRLGSQKVILNTLDTSNRILERLVNFMIGKMDKRGILRNAGIENSIINELNKKKELENKHICTKMQICPTNESFTKFVVEILNTIMSSPDNKIIEIRDACTEVLKNTDFSHVLDPDTETRFLKGIADVERYDVGTMRPIFFIMKNILSSKNSPIKVVGPEDGRVNKTLAFLEMVDNWEKKLPPNEHNILEWKDLKSSFQEWKIGKRRDIVDLVQHFTDHITKAMSEEDGRVFDRNINTVLGF